MAEILILHGWGSSSKKWDKVRHFLENQGYKVFVPDLPGFGENPAPEKAWSIDDYANWVEKYISDSQTKGELVEPFFLAAHSFGGAIAVKFVLKFPEKIKKLFLVAPALVRKKTFKKETIKRVAKIFSFLSKKIKKIIYRKIFRSDYPLEPGVMRETYLKAISENLLNELAKISVPTVIIWGENDKITPFKDAFLVKEKIKKSEIEILKKTDHDLNVKNPSLLSETILKFLK